MNNKNYKAFNAEINEIRRNQRAQKQDSATQLKQAIKRENAQSADTIASTFEAAFNAKIWDANKFAFNAVITELKSEGVNVDELIKVYATLKDCKSGVKAENADETLYNLFYSKSNNMIIDYIKEKVQVTKQTANKQLTKLVKLVYGMMVNNVEYNIILSVAKQTENCTNTMLQTAFELALIDYSKEKKSDYNGDTLAYYEKEKAIIKNLF